MISFMIKLLPEFVMFFWIVAFFKLVFQNDYINYLRPDFLFLVVLGLVLSIFVFLGGLFSERRKMSSFLVINNSLIIAIPLLFYLTGNGFSLNSFAYLKKKTGLEDIQNQKISREAETRDNVEENVDKEKLKEMTLVQLANPMENFIGQRVKTKGQIYHDKKIPYIVLFRFMITCCIADARPVGVYLPISDMTKSFKRDDWVEVEGRFITKMESGRKIKVIVPEKVYKVKEPSHKEKYLYYK